jgi:hypothetical protein
VLNPNYVYPSNWVEPESTPSVPGDRCWSCEHETRFHQPDGCWFTITQGRQDSVANCSCAVPRVVPGPTIEHRTTIVPTTGGPLGPRIETTRWFCSCGVKGDYDYLMAESAGRLAEEHVWDTRPSPSSGAA